MNTAEQAQVPEAATPAGDPTVGDMMVAARQAQNLSVTDVANRLKLSVQQVQALEQGAYDRLPGPVFVRGFTRNYARLLKLDPEAMLRAVDAQLPRAAAERTKASDTNIPMPAKNSGRWPLLAGMAAVVFLGAALVDVLWPEVPPGTGTAPAPAASATPPAAPAPAAASPVTPAATPSAVTAQASAPSVPAGAPSAPPAAAVPATYQPDAAGAHPLRLVFDQRSWVQVKDASGTVVLEALYPPGSSREISARPPLTLVIGNAPGVRVIYGDRPVDLAPHTRVAVARLTLE